jgi:hypothetical protein
MKRRSFIAAVLGVLAAPFAAIAARTKLCPPIKMIEIDYFAAFGGTFNEPKPWEGVVHYRCDGGDWKERSGLLPLEIEPGVTLDHTDDRETWILVDGDTVIRFTSLDRYSFATPSEIAESNRLEECFLGSCKKEPYRGPVGIDWWIAGK